MSRFKIGERVALNGLLGELHGGEAIGIVVRIAPDTDGMDEFDKYKIAFEDSRQLQVCSFQLTHVVLADVEHEKAASFIGSPFLPNFASLQPRWLRTTRYQFLERRRWPLLADRLQ